MGVSLRNCQVSDPNAVSGKAKLSYDKQEKKGQHCLRLPSGHNVGTLPLNLRRIDLILVALLIFRSKLPVTVAGADCPSSRSWNPRRNINGSTSRMTTDIALQDATVTLLCLLPLHVLHAIS